MLDYSFYGPFFQSEYFGNELNGTLLLFILFIGLFIFYKYQAFIQLSYVTLIHTYKQTFIPNIKF